MPSAASVPTVSVVAPTAALRADVVVVGVHAGPDGPRLAAGSEPVDAALGGRLFAALRALGVTGEADEVLLVPTLGLADVTLVAATGLGTGGDTTDGAPEIPVEAARRAVGAALRRLTGHRRVHLALDADAGALAEGALLGAYAFTAYKSDPQRPQVQTVALPGSAAQRAAVKRATAVARAVGVARDLVNTPPNVLYPAAFAAEAQALVAGTDVTCEVLDEKALKRGRYGGILGVGQGSVRPPRLVRLTYRPAKARAHLALVGKGITFDSGGLNLKTANMAAMKSDMGGAAAAIASVLAIATLGLPVAVTATVPMAENMPSGTAYRPSDILRMYDGSTVEVGNTDAEGRLILADAITRAAEDSPDALIEASTLTGAQLLALGPRLIGAMGDEAWRDEVVAAGAAVGESSWPMPLPDDLRARLDSPVADIVNVAGERWAGMLIAGRFLGDYVPDGLPWVHLDIAGPAFNERDAYGYTPRGGTGAGVRTMIAAAELLARR